MRLASFSVHNYRAFADSTAIELRPLTLLFGYNSAGKSALLRWLPIVAASTEPDATTALALDSAAARGATFDELLSRYTADPKLSLGLCWEDPATAKRLRAHWRLLWEDRRKQQSVEQFQASSAEIPSEQTIKAVWSLDDEAPIDRRRYLVDIDDALSTEIELAFDGLLPHPGAFEGPAGALIGELNDRVRNLRRNLHWLTALRATPRRSKVLGAPPRRLGADGALAGDFLAHDRLDDGQLLATVSTWFEKATGHGLDTRIDSVGGSDRFSVTLSPSSSPDPVHVPLPDTGEGMAQVLPVIVLGALARRGRLGDAPILLIEHPELHLHPKVHADLAGFFCTLVREAKNTTTVIETHSENLLLRVQLAIARGEVNARDVIVHWVRGLPEGPAVVDPVTFDSLARPLGDWPPGVFSSDIEQARELVALRRATTSS